MKKSKSNINFWSVYIWVSYLLLIFQVISCSSSKYPNKGEIDHEIMQYRNESNKADKVRIVNNLLNRMKSPLTNADSQNVSYLIEILTSEYKKNKDDALLIAIDNVEIDGGFANDICSFYRNNFHEKEFRERYGKNSINGKYLERCLGISLSRDEFIEINK